MKKRGKYISASLLLSASVYSFVQGELYVDATSTENTPGSVTNVENTTTVSNSDAQQILSILNRAASVKYFDQLADVKQPTEGYHAYWYI